MKIIRYTQDRKAEWDTFVEGAKNSTFLFMRAYMDYHADRFVDHSLMYYDDKKKLIALLPANERDGVVYSHQGLTYGGFILSSKVHGSQVLEAMIATKEYLAQCGIDRMVYKQMPSVYRLMPAEEDEYALWRCGAEKSACQLSVAVDLSDAYLSCTRLVRQTKKSDRNKLEREGYTICFGADLRDFWHVLTENLMSYHNVAPVHTLEEMQLLKDRFPENIVCCTALNVNGEVEAGVVLYLTQQTVHTQYISASAEGKRNNALDFLILTLINHYKEQRKYRYFEFGTCNEDGGHILNEGLLAQKEGFGARGIVYNQFVIKI